MLFSLSVRLLIIYVYKPRLAAKCILKMMKRWPSTISKCVLPLADNLKKPSLPENVVLGSCAVLSSQTVLKRLTTVSLINFS